MLFNSGVTTTMTSSIHVILHCHCHGMTTSSCREHECALKVARYLKGKISLIMHRISSRLRNQKFTWYSVPNLATGVTNLR